MGPSYVESESPAGFRFAVISALIRNEGYSLARAEDLLRVWQRYARYAMLSQKSPSSTAAHLARFERYQRAAPSRDHDGYRNEISPALADEQIAEDLRRQADIIYNDDPDHARALHRVSDMIEFAPNAHLRDTPHLAAQAILRHGAQERRCEVSTEIVSLIFPRDFNSHDVKQWARTHGFVADNLELSRTTGATRAPQRPTTAFEPGSFRTIVLSEAEDIRAVIGCPLPTRDAPRRKRGR